MSIDPRSGEGEGGGSTRIPNEAAVLSALARVWIEKLSGRITNYILFPDDCLTGVIFSSLFFYPQGICRSRKNQPDDSRLREKSKKERKKKAS